MKKLFATLMLTGALALSGCMMDMVSANDVKVSASGAGYSADIYTGEEAIKVYLPALELENTNVQDAVVAMKDTQDTANKDFLLVLVFTNADEPEAFLNKGDNLRTFNAYIEGNVGSSLTGKMGMHNNVAYAGSETSVRIALGI